MNHEPNSASSRKRTAAQWLARRDRGLTAEEQDSYLQWLREDPANGAEIAELGRAWMRLDGLNEWHPVHSVRPNPDLLVPRRRRTWVWAGLSLATAAAIATLVWLQPGALFGGARHIAMVTPGPQRMTLPDGSLVEMNREAQIELDFTAAERDVTLVRGEAHFIVAKNAARPFVVTASHVAVRAVGTAFDVKLQPAEVAVLVTEGQVQLNGSNSRFLPPAARDNSPVSAGQLAIVHPTADATHLGKIVVRDLTAAEIERELAWQTMRLEFADLPLRDVVEEFNRFNSRKLVIGDAETGDILVGGSFRADNLEPFIRLLDVGFGVNAEPHGDELVLRRR